MNFDIEYEKETDGRWIAEIPEIPGVFAYGVTPLQAGAQVKALALRVLAERLCAQSSFYVNKIDFRES
jgi:predicted RNase H-like HicB family nuclease